MKWFVVFIKLYFIGINFHGYKLPRFRDFFGVREGLYPRNITFMGVIEISIKNPQKWRQNKRISPKFHTIGKVYTRKISERHHSRKLIPAKVNFYSFKKNFIYIFLDSGSARHWL